MDDRNRGRGPDAGPMGAAGLVFACSPGAATASGAEQAATVLIFMGSLVDQVLASKTLLVIKGPQAECSPPSAPLTGSQPRKETALSRSRAHEWCSLVSSHKKVKGYFPSFRQESEQRFHLLEPAGPLAQHGSPSTQGDSLCTPRPPSAGGHAVGQTPGHPVVCQEHAAASLSRSPSQGAVRFVLNTGPQPDLESSTQTPRMSNLRLKIGSNHMKPLTQRSKQ